MRLQQCQASSRLLATRLRGIVHNGSRHQRFLQTATERMSNASYGLGMRVSVGLLIGAGAFGLYTQSKAPILCDDGAKQGVYDRWKDDKIGAYENRIRSFSHPWKVFQYFATAHKHGQPYMTTEDFIRSLMPYRSYRASGKLKRVPSAEAFFALADTDGDGLISFSEYMIFLCLLGTPEFHWKISFKLFDINGDGTVSKDEFEKIMLHHATGLGFGSRLGNQERQKVDVTHSGIYKLFFGNQGEKNMVYDEFIDFMRRLHLETLKLEFAQFDVEEKTNSISMRDFALSCISYAPPSQLPKLIDKAAQLPNYAERVTFDEFYAFDQMVRTRLHDLGLAYKLYTSMEHGLDRTDFRRVVKAVTTTDLTAGQVDVIFEMFDFNHDGYLNIDEFYQQVMKGRHSRGLDTDRSIGISKFFHTVSKCVREAYDET
ncbi:uncharacterized protein EV422DRAFT_525419 [Fimicolochytrium jonesii]|uniref:uncharacterized protein n=1 Tax=Fimicolochytrium jonesii TaxID=1396493 RepID=UPI0022FDB5F9|nr:uncharacterized protein EV422DRAFT_525419 [Fimicolochytrium jonesii]KAI8822027.1 hypothetical protein EV422DRAFT_525419 [Fimicolochytrium jonesii]